MTSHPGVGPADRQINGPSLVSVAGITLDQLHRTVAMPGGREVALTPLQAAVLAHLMDHSGRVCTREDLMCQALGYSVPVDTRTVDVHVATLRGKLGGVLRIRAVRGVGYMLEPVSAEAPGRKAATQTCDDLGR